jgi:hypothetical protein
MSAPSRHQRAVYTRARQTLKLPPTAEQFLLPNPKFNLRSALKRARAEVNDCLIVATKRTAPRNLEPLLLNDNLTQTRIRQD